MNGLCPECGNPPRYHSFCSLCCKLFPPRSARWRAECDLVWRRIDRRAGSAARLEAERQRQLQEREAIIAQVRALRNQDMMAAEAQAALGMTPNQLGRYCDMAGLPPFRRPGKARHRDAPLAERSKAWPPERLAALRRLLEHDGASYRAAGKRLKASRGSIARAVRDLLPELTRKSKRGPSLPVMGGRP